VPSVAFGTIEDRPVLAVGGGMEVRLWDAATGQPLGEPLEASDGVRAVAMAELEGAAVVAAGGGFGTVRLWDAATGRLLRQLQIAGAHARAVALGQMGAQPIVAAGGTAGAVLVWEVDTGAVVGPPLGVGAPVRGVALARDASDQERLTLVVGRGDGTVEQWDVATGTLSGPVVHVGAEVNAVAWGEVDAEPILATADASGVARVWNPRTGQPASDPCRHTDEVRALALAHVQGMPLLATASLDTTAAIWDPRSGQPSGEPLPHPGPVHDLAFGSVDGRIMLATACADGNTRLWDPLQPSGARIAVQDNIGSVALVSNDGEVLLAAGGRSGKVYLRHGERGDRLAEIALEPRPGPVVKGRQPSVDVALGVVAGRRVLATSHQSVQLWDVDDPTLHERTVLGGYRWPDARHTGPLALRLKGDRALLATVPAWSAPITLVDLMTSQTLGTVGDGEGARQIAFLSGQELDALAVIFNDHIEVHNLASGELHGPPVPAADWTRHHLAMATIDGTDVLAVWGPEDVQFWDVAAGTAYAPPVPISGTQKGIAFGSVDGRQILLTAHYATVRAWNPRTGRRIAELPFGTSIDAMAVEQTADGRLLVAVSGPGIVVTELFNPAART
jgi:WD40 repeat protein